jgi:Uma2 family endonuclease
MSTDLVQYKKKGAITQYLISADDYQKMGAIGIFEDKPRVELIDGLIIARSPISHYHNSHVNKINQFFVLTLSGKVIIQPQGSIRLDNYSEPEPDIALLRLKKDFHYHSNPTPKDIYLLIEVSIETLSKDRTIKLKKYAQANIPEYWIVIPKEKKIEVYRKPENGAYMQMKTYGKEDEWEFGPFDLEIKGSDLLID